MPNGNTKRVTDTYVGSDVPMEKARIRIVKRILLNVQQTDSGCWIWQGWKTALGYGSVHIWGKNWPVHRLSYIVFKGEIPEGMQACHTCDTPACCNPDHIFLGTAKDNALDSRQKGRHYTSAKTHCTRGHAYTEFGFTRPDGRRYCSECERTRYMRTKGLPKNPPNGKKTHCIRGHELAGDNLYIKPNGERQCRKCRLAVVQRIQAERRADNGEAKS